MLSSSRITSTGKVSTIPSGWLQPKKTHNYLWLGHGFIPSSSSNSILSLLLPGCHHKASRRFVKHRLGQNNFAYFFLSNKVEVEVSLQISSSDSFKNGDSCGKKAFRRRAVLHEWVAVCASIWHYLLPGCIRLYVCLYGMVFAFHIFVKLKCLGKRGNS